MGRGFTKQLAHQQLVNLSDAQAEKWVKLAEDDYVRRLNLGATEKNARDLAVKHANVKLIGNRAYNI